MKSQEKTISLKRKLFNERFDELSDSDIQKEILFAKYLNIDKLERIRVNTSVLIWFLIIIPIIITLVTMTLIA
jgi:predicted nucleic acid-binding Zn ribbon protein